MNEGRDLKLLPAGSKNPLPVHVVISMFFLLSCWRGYAAPSNWFSS